MLDIEITDIPAQTVAALRRRVPMAGLAAFFGEAYSTVAAAVAAAGGVIVGMPLGWYHGIPTDTVDVSAGFAVSGVGGPLTGEVELVERPGGRAAVCMHIGPYDAMAATYEALQAWAADHELVLREEMWEEYLSEPTGDPASWRTRIIWPVV